MASNDTKAINDPSQKNIMALLQQAFQEVTRPNLPTHLAEDPGLLFPGTLPLLPKQFEQFVLYVYPETLDLLVSHTLISIRGWLPC